MCVFRTTVSAFLSPRAMLGAPIQRRDEAANGDTGRDVVRFLRAWWAAPLQTGAQLPSSPDLARAMAAAIDPMIPGAVVELGAGTGAVTAALIARGVPPERLVLIETNPAFCAMLRARYPRATVLEIDAYAAPRHLRALGIGPIAAIVSGLPLLVRKAAARQRLLLGCLRLAAPGALFVQFTYFYQSPIPTGGNITATASPMIWRNLWPARVWSFRRAFLAPTAALSGI
jgi:phosphatidylethanolamine/phosphatidyl-N-methylethanolamine N-methyltransferase